MLDSSRQSVGRWLLLISAIALISSCKKDPDSNALNSNRAPIANAGADRTLRVPADSVELVGSGTDEDGKITAYKWTLVSGPPLSVIVSPDAAVTIFKDLKEGIYEIAFRVKDNAGNYGRDTVLVYVIDPSPVQGINCSLVPLGTFFEPRSNMATASVGNKILFAGGMNTAGVVSSRVDVYDVVTDSWSSSALSEGRAGIGAVAIGSKVLFGGGAKNFDYTSGWHNIVSRVDILDLSDNSWSKMELPEPEIFLWGYGVTASAGNKAIFYSDYLIFDLNIPNVHVYDMLTSSWSKERLSEVYNKTQLAAASIGNKVFFAGGYYGLGKNFPPQRSKVVDIYFPESDSWSVDSLSEARSFLQAGVLNNRVYFAGGRTDYGEFSSIIDIYDNATRTWATANLSKAGFIAGVATAGNRIYFFSSQKWLDIYDASSDSWSYAELPITLNDPPEIISTAGNIYITNGFKMWRVQF